MKYGEGKTKAAHAKNNQKQRQGKTARKNQCSSRRSRRVEEGGGKGKGRVDRLTAAAGGGMAFAQKKVDGIKIINKC